MLVVHVFPVMYQLDQQMLKFAKTGKVVTVLRNHVTHTRNVNPVHQMHSVDGRQRRKYV